MLAALEPPVSILPTVALLGAFRVQLFIAELVGSCCLCAPDVLALVVPGLALAIVAAALILIAGISILFMKIWWALAGVSSTIFSNITPIHSIPTFVPSWLKEARGIVTARPIAAVGPVGKRTFLTAQSIAFHVEATIAFLPGFYISISTFRGLEQLCWPVEKTGSASSL